MAIGKFYTNKTDLELVVVLIYIVIVAGLMVIFISLRGWVVIDQIYLFIFCMLINALRLP